MPPEGSVAEIMSLAKFNYAGFRNLAKMRGLNYVSAHGKGAVEWENLGNSADRDELARIAEKVRKEMEKEEAEREKERAERERKEKETEMERKGQELQDEERNEMNMAQEVTQRTADKRRRGWEEVMGGEDVVEMENGTGIGFEVDELPVDGESGRMRKRWDWQEGEFVYIEDDLFQSLVDAAINAQLNRGLRRLDVPGSRRRG